MNRRTPDPKKRHPPSPPRPHTRPGQHPPPKWPTWFIAILLFLGAGGGLVLIEVFRSGPEWIKALRPDPTSIPTLTSAPDPTWTPSPTIQSTPIPNSPTPSFTPSIIHTPSFTPSTTPSPEQTFPSTPFVQLVSPAPDTAVFCIPGFPCQFEISGTSARVAEDLGLVIWTLVHPDNPVGQGWYLQRTAIPKTGGEWYQPINFIGEAGRIGQGDTFSVIAIVTGVDAVYQEITLHNLAGAAILELRLIEGLVAQSDPVVVHVVLVTPTP